MWQLGMGGAVPTPIPVSEISDYAARLGLRIEEAVPLIQALDIQWRTDYLNEGAPTS